MPPLIRRRIRKIANVAHFVAGHQFRAQRRKAIERFAQEPLAARLLGLPIAGRDVVTAGVSGDVFQSALAWDMPTACADDDHELRLVIDFVREPRHDDRIALRPKCRGEFAKHHGLRRRLFAGFLGVIGVVQPNANDFLRFRHRRKEFDAGRRN